MAKARVLIADDHEVVRQGILSLVKMLNQFEVCGEAMDGRDAVQKAKELRPDIVIIDIGMPRLNGLDATRQIMRERPSTKVLVLTMHDSEQVVREVLEAGARGYLLKSDAGRDLVSALEALQLNKTFFTTKISEMVLASFLNSRTMEPTPSNALGLTSREREVIQLVAEGKSTKEVAVTLGLSVKTADTHRSNLMRKLGVHSVSELVLYAIRNNIIHVVEPLDAPGPSK
jgi:Response regulator containing a CheY-like receiver domain and an HTH DNA-binding domain